MPHAFSRIAVVGPGTPALHAAQTLLSNGMYVDVFTPTVAPAGLCRQREELPPSAPGAPEIARLRVFGNVDLHSGSVRRDDLHRYYRTVLDAADVYTWQALSSVGVHPGVQDVVAPHHRAGSVIDLLRRRQVAFTLWQGLYTHRTPSTDWHSLAIAARGIPVCV